MSNSDRDLLSIADVKRLVDAVIDAIQSSPKRVHAASAAIRASVGTADLVERLTALLAQWAEEDQESAHA